MSKFTDFNFSDDDPGPDTDPTPDDPDAADPTDGIPDDATNYDEPGVGDSFRGADPSIFDGSGNPEEPEAQTDQARGTVEVEEQSATIPKPDQYGQQDNPEATEAKGDEQSGDNEQDDANVDEVISKTEDDDFYPEDLLDELSAEIEIPDLEEIDEEILSDEEFEDLLTEYLKAIEEEVDDLMIDSEELEGYEDVYADDVPVPELGEFIGTLDISDYIGDLANDSDLIEFQDLFSIVDGDFLDDGVL